MKLIELKDYRELYNDDNLFTLLGSAMFSPSINKVKNAVESIYQKQQGYVFLCEREEKTVGLIGLKRVDNDFEIMHIAVDKDFKRQGIGTFMIDQIIKYPGIYSIFLETDDESVDFYRSLGFSCDEEVDDMLGVARYKCRKKV